jgi:hypothetical protein
MATNRDEARKGSDLINSLAGSTLFGGKPTRKKKKTKLATQQIQGGEGSKSIVSDNTDASGVGVVKTLDPIQKLGAVPTPEISNLQDKIGTLGSARQQLDAGQQATFNFTNPDGTGRGSFSTSDPEGATRVALGSGIRGGQVSTVNTQNILESNMLDRARQAVSTLKGQGASASAQLDAFKSITNPDQSPGAKALADINRASRDGTISGDDARAQRSQALGVINSEQEASKSQRVKGLQLAQKQNQAAQDTAIKAANATTARGRLEASNRQFLGQERTRESKRIAKQDEASFKRLNDPENPTTIADESRLIGTVKAVQLSEEGNTAVNEAKAAIFASTDDNGKKVGFRAFMQRLQDLGLNPTAEEGATLLNS